MGVAHRAHLTVLEHAQQLGLEFGRHFADLVQQHGAAVSAAQQAGPVAVRPAERALAVAEKFALQQLAGQSGAVDLYERGRVPEAGRMQSRGRQFFAGTGFAGDQHGNVRGRGPGDPLAHAQGRRAFAQKKAFRRAQGPGAVFQARDVLVQAVQQKPLFLPLEMAFQQKRAHIAEQGRVAVLFRPGVPPGKAQQHAAQGNVARGGQGQGREARGGPDRPQ